MDKPSPSDSSKPDPQHHLGNALPGTSSFWAELKRRRVVRVAVTYAVVAWLLIQIAATVFPQLGMPEWAPSLVTLLLLIGFPVALVLAWAFELTPDGIKATKSTQAESSENPVSEKQQRQRNWLSLGFAAAVPTVIFGALAVYFYAARSTVVAAAEATEKSIAVLPLENMSPDQENAFFADGVQEDILTNLSKVDELFVISRSSTLQFRNPDRNLRQIGAELGVRYLVEGSVRRAGDRVRVTVQLIDGTTDEHLWAETYDRSLHDIFAIQSEVAKTIADKLQAVLTPEEIALIDYRPTENQEAYDNWIKLQQLNQISSSRWEEKVAYLERAVELDPGFSEAWAQLAIEYLFWGRNDGDEDRMEKGRRILEKADWMARGTSHVLTAQAMFARADQRDLEKSIVLAKKALAIDPDYWPAHKSLALSYRDTRRYLDMLYHEEKVLEADPLSERANRNVFAAYQTTRQWSKANELCRKNLERAIARGQEGQIRLWQRFIAMSAYAKDGDFPAYVDAIERISHTNEDAGLLFYHALLVRDLPRALTLWEGGADLGGLILPGDSTVELLLLWELGESDKLRSYIQSYRNRLRDTSSRLAIADAIEGRLEQSEGNLAKALENSFFRYSDELSLAIALIVSGDDNAAIDRLEAAEQDGYLLPLNRYLQVLFIFDRLKGNPRYDALMEDK